MTVSGLAANRRPRIVVTRSPRITYSGFSRVAGVPDLTQKLQTGTIPFECLIGLPGTQGALLFQLNNCTNIINQNIRHMNGVISTFQNMRK